MLKIKIQEIIPLTIQGEGFNQGMPCGFIRLFGCPVNCSFCDTGYKDQTKPPMFYTLSIFEILQELTQVSNVVVTGGEPCVNPAFGDLVTSLLFNKKRVFVETSGIKTLPILDDIWLTLSPKEHISQSGKLDKKILEYVNELKLIISNEDDFVYYRDIIQIAKNSNIPVYIQPEWSNRQSLTDLLIKLANNNNVLVSNQVHKLIGVK